MIIIIVVALLNHSISSTEYYSVCSVSEIIASENSTKLMKLTRDDLFKWELLVSWNIHIEYHLLSENPFSKTNLHQWNSLSAASHKIFIQNMLLYLCSLVQSFTLLPIQNNGIIIYFFLSSTLPYTEGSTVM